MSERLINIISDEYFRITDDEWGVIQELTRIITLEEIKQHYSCNIRYLCIIPKNYSIISYRVDKNMSEGYYLSHDDSCLLIIGENQEVSDLLCLCSKNLVFLRIDALLPFSIDLSSMMSLRFLRIGGRFDSSGAVMSMSGLEQLTNLEELILDGTFDFSYLQVSNMRNLKKYLSYVIED